eukprot:TRINITY_DN4890_c0_g1_i1.p1 TRINITY_DN4890_c0_g1~~TRINITY_DN4890_c0_g1_i1.p1  ORF type:complete len:461 (-),score=68.87 TRINITY_DN4890_c0_g1_i1:145-1527(-)
MTTTMRSLQEGVAGVSTRVLLLIVVLSLSVLTDCDALRDGLHRPQHQWVRGNNANHEDTERISRIIGDNEAREQTQWRSWHQRAEEQEHPQLQRLADIQERMNRLRQEMSAVDGGGLFHEKRRNPRDGGNDVLPSWPSTFTASSTTSSSPLSSSKSSSSIPSLLFGSEFTFPDVPDEGLTAPQLPIVIPQAQQKIVFFHIQKTGGTTFSVLLMKLLECACGSRCGAPAFQQYRCKGPFNGRWFSNLNNIACGIHPNYQEFLTCREAGANPRFVTIIRDPVTRFISEYYHCHPKAAKIRAGSGAKRCWAEYTKGDLELSLDDSVNTLYPHPAANRQTRMLAGYKLGEWETSVLGNEEHERQALRKAMQRLADMDFVGTNDDLQGALRALAGTYGLPYDEVRHTVARKHNTQTKDDAIPDALMRRIVEINHLDSLLYEYAKRLYAARSKRLGLVYANADADT